MRDAAPVGPTVSVRVTFAWAILCLAGCASLPISGRFAIARTDHFEVFAPARVASAARVARDLERFHRLVLDLARIEEDPVGRRRAPIRVIVLSAEGFETFRPPAAGPGYLLRAADGVYLALDGSDLGAALRAARHAYVHELLPRISGFPHPVWYEEGLAELLAMVDFDDGGVAFGRVPPRHAERLRYGRTLGLRTLLRARDLASWPEDVREEIYAESWAWVSRLFLEGRGPALTEFVRLIATGGPDISEDDASRAAFSSPLYDVDRDQRQYLAQGRFPVMRLAREPVEGPTPRVEPASRGEVALRLASLALGLGRDFAPLAEQMYAQALEASPGDARALLGLSTAVAVAGRPAQPLFDAASRAGADASALGRARATIELARAFVSEGRVPGAAPGLLGRALQGKRAAGIDLELMARYAGRPARHVDLFRTSDLDVIDDLIGEAEPVERARIPRLAIHRPEDGTTVRAQRGWVEIVGQAGNGAAPRLDVVFALDRTASTTRQSGIGGTRFEVELRAIRELVSKLDETNTRAAVVSFGAGAQIELPLGSPRELLAQLDARRVRPDVGLGPLAELLSLQATTLAPDNPLRALEDLDASSIGDGGADMANALTAATIELTSHATGAATQRRVVMFSDERPGFPDDIKALRSAKRAAERLKRCGIRLDMYAVGSFAERRERTFRKLSDPTGGEFVAVKSAQELPNVIEPLKLEGLASISIRNLRSGEPGRAVRVFDNGGFDGFVRLEPGENTIEVSALLADGAPVSGTIRVVFEPSAEPTEADGTLDRLRERTIETEMLRELDEQREGGGRRRLDVDVEGDPRPEAEPAPEPRGEPR